MFWIYKKKEVRKVHSTAFSRLLKGGSGWGGGWGGINLGGNASSDANRAWIPLQETSNWGKFSLRIFFCVFCAITSHKNENEPLPPKEKDGWPGEWRNSDDGSWQQQEWWITSPTATNIWGGEHNHSFQNLLGDVLSSACNSWSGSLCLLWLFDQHNEYVQLKFGRPGILRIPLSHF